MIISCIVATAHENVIGKNNQIPWYLPADLKYFKKVTTGHHIIMGRNCFESIGRPLPNRTNIIITRDAFFMSSNCLIARSIKEALEIAMENSEEEAFIIGGGQIYEQSQGLWDKLYLTEVDVKVDGDVFFPAIDPNEWTMMSEECHQKDEKNEFDYCFRLYDRRE
jgi:dihydrofolate reductase